MFTMSTDGTGPHGFAAECSGCSETYHDRDSENDCAGFLFRINEQGETMRIKVGNRVIDSKDEPIMVILTDQDKVNIGRMDPDCTKYCEFEKDDHDIEDIECWMADT